MAAKRLLLILTVLALLVASGVVWAAATATTYTWLQIPLAITDEGTTWTVGGITHLRGQVIDTMVIYDYDGDGNVDEMAVITLTMNSSRDVNGAGPTWGTWSEYEDESHMVLLGSGTFQGKYTCWELQGGPEYAYACGDVLGWRVGPNGEWGQAKATAVMYSEPDFPPLLIRGEARFLVPGGE